MLSTAKLFSASLFSMCVLFAQGSPGHREFGLGGLGGPRFDGPPVTGAPYSAIKTETRQQTLADGNQIQQTHTAKIYRDAEGRTRTEATMTTASGSPRTLITIFDPVAGFVAHLNPADSTGVKQLLPKPPSDAQKDGHMPPADANAPQVTKTDLGSSNIAGVAATGTRTTVTVPAGAIGNAQAIVKTREVWISTALKVPVKMTSNDPRHGTSTMELSNISQAPPEASLFAIPSGYAVKDAPAHGHRGPGGEGMGPGGPGGPPPFDGGSL